MWFGGHLGKGCISTACVERGELEDWEEEYGEGGGGCLVGRDRSGEVL